MCLDRTEPAPRRREPLPKVTRSEVSKHNTADNNWIIVDDKAYDVTNWGAHHPGGKDILTTHAGRDATEVFYNFHAAKSFDKLPFFCVGELDREQEEKVCTSRDKARRAILDGYRELRAELEAKGYFRSSKLYYAWKVFTHVAMLSFAVTLLLLWPHAPMAVSVSAVVLGIFYSQNGWLAHDFLHHQVFKNRQYGNFVGMMLGNLFQGFSISWWKNKHNTHHASSNELDNDPDIDQLPMLAFHPVLLRGGNAITSSRVAKLMIPIQVFTFIPLVSLSRWNWALQSMLYVLKNDHKHVEQYRGVELGLMAIHWLSKLLLFVVLPFWWAVAFLLVSEGIGGFMIGLFFVLNHNGMRVFSEEEYKTMDFVTIQVLSSRDIKATFLSNFLMGGLNYQIEHHLFPGIPRHHFHKVSPLVDKFCAAHNIPLHRTSLLNGFVEFFTSLAESQTRVREENYEVPPLKYTFYGEEQ